jgi:uncharacterized membrane-anchored protein YitT (DUF2179 family)
MTPKEKAKELVDKMLLDHDMPYYLAMQCALIAVDEMLNNYEEQYKYCKTKIYFQKVKQEIEKL